MAALAEALAYLIVLLGGERPLAHPRGIGLGDAQHMGQRRGANARANRGLAGNGVGGGDIG